MADTPIMDSLNAELGGNQIDDLATPDPTPSSGSLMEFVGQSIPDPEIETPAETLKTSVYVGADTETGQAQKIMSLGAELGLEESVVRSTMPEAERASRMNFADLDLLSETHPKTSQWLSENPTRTAAVRNDIQQFKNIENASDDYSTVQQLGMGVLSFVFEASAGLANFPAMLMASEPGGPFVETPDGRFVRRPLTEEERLEGVKRLLDGPLPNFLKRMAEKFRPPAAKVSISAAMADAYETGDYSRAGEVLAVQVVSQIPQIGLIFMGPFGIAALSGSVAGGAFEEGIEEGAEVNDAVVNGMVHGLAEAVFERAGTFNFMQQWGKSVAKKWGRETFKQTMWHFFKQTMAAMGVEAGEEILTETVQYASSKIFGVDDTPFDIAQYRQRALDAGILGGAVGASLTNIGATAKGLMKRAEVKRTQRIYKALGDSVEAMEAREKIPKVIFEGIEILTANGPIENIYVDKDALSKVLGDQLPKFLNATGLDEAYNQADQTGGKIKISTAVWSAQIATIPETHNALKDDVVFNPEELTGNERKLNQEALKQEAEAAQDELVIDDPALQEEGVATDPKKLTDIVRDKQRAEEFRGSLRGVITSQDTDTVTKAVAIATLQTLEGITEELPDNPETRFEAATGEFSQKQANAGIPAQQVRRNTELFDSYYRTIADRLGGTPIEALESEQRDIAIRRDRGDTRTPEPGKTLAQAPGTQPFGAVAQPELFTQETFFDSKFQIDIAREKAFRIGNFLWQDAGDGRVTRVIRQPKGRFEIVSPSLMPLEQLPAWLDANDKSGSVVKALNNGTLPENFREPKLLFQSSAEVSPLGFFSKLTEEVQKMDFKSIPANELKNRINKLPGIKKEEIEWLGLNEWLDGVHTVGEGEGKKTTNKVTKTEVMEFLRANGVRVEQVVLSSDFRDPNASGGDIDFGDLRWDDGETVEPDSDQVNEEVEQLYLESYESFKDYVDADNGSEINEFLEELEEDEETEKLAEAKALIKELEKKRTPEESFSDRSKAWTRLQELIFETSKGSRIQTDLYDRAYQHLMESDYADVKYTESETGWELIGNDERGYYSPELGDHFETSLNEAKIRLASKMLERGEIEGDASELIREQDFSWNRPKPKLPSEDTLRRAALKRIRNNPEEYERRVIERFGVDVSRKKYYKGYLAERDEEAARSDPSNARNQISTTIDHPIINGKVVGNAPKGWAFTYSIDKGNKVSTRLEAATAEEAQAKAKQFLSDKGVFGKKSKDETTPDDGTFDPNAPTGRARWISYKVAGGTNYREILLTLPNADGEYRSGHFNAKNILAHIRVTDREGRDGKKILFIEEIQSDWHQAGREKGYQRTNETYEPGAVPDAPFKKTDAWAALAMKRIFQMAVDQGYDSVAISPASVQTERWPGSTIAWRKVTGLAKVNPLSGQKVFFQSRESFRDSGFTEEDGPLTPFTGFLFGVGNKNTSPEVVLKGTTRLVTTFGEVKELIQDNSASEIGPRALTARATSVWERMQKEEEGSKRPEEDAFRFFYDNLLPKKVIPKLLKKLDKEASIREGTIPNEDDPSLPENGLPVPTIAITPAMKESLKKGQTLFQDENGKRARIDFMDTTSLITLFNNADFSSLPHEISHHWVEQRFNIIDKLKVRDPSTLTPQEQTFIADGEEMLRFAGVTNRDQLWDNDAKGHEKIASEFEKYLATGQAPSKRLRKAFYRFQQWFLQLWKKVRNDPTLQIDPAIRNVFDRMLATDEEIEAAANEYVSVFDSPQDAGMSPLDAEKSRQVTEDARDAGRDIIRGELNQQQQREQSKEFISRRELVEAQVEAEVLERPEYVLLETLKTGTTPQGVVIDDAPMFLDKDLTIEIIGRERTKTLPSGILIKGKGKDLPGGLDPEVVAEQLDYGSADEMFQALEGMEAPNTVIQRTTDERMAEEFGDIVNDGEIEEKAVDAVHNQFRAKQLRFELEWIASNHFAIFKKLAKRIGSRLPNQTELRAQAELTIARLRVRDSKPGQYSRAESKSARLARDAFFRGDFETAWLEKRKELFNYELFRAAKEAQAKAETAVNYFKSFDRATKWARIGKAGESYQIQIDALLERFSFRKLSLKQVDKLKSLNRWIIEQEELGHKPDIPQRLLDESFRKNFKDMTHAEMTDLLDAIKSIEHLAKTKNSMLQLKENRDYFEVRDSIVGEIGTHYNLDVEPVDLTPSFGAKLVKGVKRAMAKHTRMEFFFKQLDGFADNGVVWNALFRPFADAEAASDIKKKELADRWIEIWEPYSRQEKRQMNRKKHFAYLKNSKQTGNLTKFNILTIGLNWGNQGNRTAITEAYQWTEEQVVQLLESELTEKDIKLLEAVWEQVNSYWPEARKLEHDMTGIAPPKVEASPFVLNGREIQGGYYPIMFDAAQSIKQSDLDTSAAIQEAFGGSYGAKAMTRKGHLIAREGSGGKPIYLEIDGAIRHMTNVIHDITHRRAVVDVARLIKDTKVREAIEAAAGREMYKQLNPWLHNIAGDQLQAYASINGERFFNLMRKNATIMGLGMNVTSALVQMASAPITIKELGFEYSLRGLVGTYGKPLDIPKQWDFVAERSVQMRNRIQNLNRDVRDAHKKLGLEGGRAESLTRDAQRMALYLIGYADKMVTVPTWIGAYQKAMDGKADNIKAGDELAAVAFADSIVRTAQTAGGAKDLAGVQMGPGFVKIFTMYYSQMSIIYNQFQSTGSRFKLDKDFKKFMSSLMLVWFAQVAMEQALRGNFFNFDDEDEEEKRNGIIRKFALFPAATVVGLRDVVGAYDWATKTGGQVRLSNPALDAMDKILKGAWTARKLFNEDEEFTRYDLKLVVEGAGYAVGLPTRQTFKSLDYLYDVMTGEEDPGLFEGPFRFLIKGKPRR